MPTNYIIHEIKEQQVCLLPEKCLFWANNNMLIIADVHLGKVMHFRKAGFPIPLKMIHEDLSKLSQLILRNGAKRVLFLGDLFHSQYNSEWQIFEEWMENFPEVSFELVLGNHDLHARKFLPDNLIVYADELEIPPFVFTHEPKDSLSDLYNLSGHIHPSVRLKGRGGQSLQLPCFFFGKRQGVLPAYGRFTGFVTIPVTQEDTIYGVADGRVFALK